MRSLKKPGLPVVMKNRVKLIESRLCFIKTLRCMENSVTTKTQMSIKEFKLDVIEMHFLHKLKKIKYARRNLKSLKSTLFQVKNFPFLWKRNPRKLSKQKIKNFFRTIFKLEIRTLRQNMSHQLNQHTLNTRQTDPTMISVNSSKVKTSNSLAVTSLCQIWNNGSRCKFSPRK